MFFFNNPSGMCEHCQGLGQMETIDIEKLLDKNKSLNEGLIPRFERSFLKKEDGDKVKYSKEIERFVIKQSCPHCHGTRLNDKVLSCKVNGKNITECADMQINELLTFIQSVHAPMAATIVSELVNRLHHMVSIGLNYLSLSRETSTLSGGESQRIKMVYQLGSSLTDLTYIFDEPSIGLHPYDISKINDLMKLLRNKGNTLLIVEHDPNIIKIADHVIDMGPGAGTNEGKIVYQGNLHGLNTWGTLTGKYLSYRPELKSDTRTPNGWLSIHNAMLHNLKNVSVRIPKGVITVVTGVAGSGKSTLINQVLPRFYPKTIFIDEKGIQASKRSNIATFTGIFDIIRKLFAKNNVVSASMFSFNSKGACPVCKGLGVTYTDLAFMDTIVTVCEECHGNRYTNEVLAYKLRGKNIGDILKMTVLEALEFFQEKEILTVLKRLLGVGITYISLGQPLSTLSGGELQRIKLALELEHSEQIYVLDEPSTGLHMADIKQLIDVMNLLVEQNSTLIVIEHNLDIICQAD